MTPFEVRNLLLAHATSWIDAPQAFSGIKEGPSVTAAQDAKEPWIRCTIAPGESFIACLGNEPEDRHTGLVMLQVFTKQPIEVSQSSLPADIVANALASSLYNHWRHRQLGGVETLTPSQQNIGPLDGYYQINVTVPYRT